MRRGRAENPPGRAVADAPLGRSSPRVRTSCGGLAGWGVGAGCPRRATRPSGRLKCARSGDLLDERTRARGRLLEIGDGELGAGRCAKEGGRGGTWGSA